MASESKAAGSSVGRKLLAVGVLLVSGYVLLKWVLGIAAKFAWLAVLLLAITGAIWALVALARD